MWWCHSPTPTTSSSSCPRGSMDDDGQCGSTSSTSASTAPGQAGRTRVWVGGDHAPQLGSSIWRREYLLLLVWRRAVDQP
ncbi:hypothetical protein GS416_05760 [Rhodococcus hoagii]|nr:hypothetical protein [Prescottella equi]